MNLMKLNLLLKGLVFIGLFSSVGVLALEAQEGTNVSTTVNCPKEQKVGFISSPYWSVRGGLFSPLYFGTLSSMPVKGSMKMGFGGSLGVEYNFSSVFGLFAHISIGSGKAIPSAYQYGYYLGRNDGYIYYPYTMIDGTVHHFPFTPSGGTAPLVGEGAKRLSNVTLEGVSMRDVESRIGLFQMSFGVSMNLTRLFFASNYEEQPLELWMRPGLYLTAFTPKLVDTKSGKDIHTAKPGLKPGLGVDFAVRYNINPHIALELNNQLIWESTRVMDGIRSARKARDSWMWQPGISFVYKFGERPAVCSATPPMVTEPVVVEKKVEVEKPVVVEKIVEVQKDIEAVMPTFASSYPKTVVLPEKKVRTQSITLALTYPVSKTEIDPNLYNNALEISRLEEVIKKVVEHPDYTLDGIKVNGYASPEGREDFNIYLSKGRAESLIALLKGKNIGVQKDIFAIGTIAENWEGLKEALKGDQSLPCSKEVLSLLDMNLSVEELKGKIKSLGCYERLLKEVYPHLRKSVCLINYGILPYTIDRAKEVIKTKPEDLDPEEMYAVALSYGLDTVEGKYALDSILKYHSETDFGKSYRALVLLKEGKEREASQLLKEVKKPIPAGLNALGIVLAHEGDLQGSLKAFDEAALKGDENALKNAQALKHYIEILTLNKEKK